MRQHDLDEDALPLVTAAPREPTVAVPRPGASGLSATPLRKPTSRGSRGRGVASNLHRDSVHTAVAAQRAVARLVASDCTEGGLIQHLAPLRKGNEPSAAFCPEY